MKALQDQICLHITVFFFVTISPDPKHLAFKHATQPSRVVAASNDGILKKKEARYLIPDAPRVPVIYQLPKMHKHSTKPSGRSIVSGIELLFSRLGEYLDYFLQPLTKKCPYLKDSKDLIELIKPMTLDDDCILASVDVNSLYTNIQKQHALKAVEWALGSTNIKQKQRFSLASLGFDNQPSFLLRSISETQWIHRLHTLSPNGLNFELDLNCFLSNW